MRDPFNLTVRKAGSIGRIARDQKTIRENALRIQRMILQERNSMGDLKETVTITRNVPSHIADLVYFARSLAGKDTGTMNDEELIKVAREFWDRQHGED